MKIEHLETDVEHAWTGRGTPLESEMLARGWTRAEDENGISHLIRRLNAEEKKDDDLPG